MQRTALSVLVSGSAIALAGGVLARWRQRRRRFSLRGRVALVTGGVRGLGFAIAEELLTAGSRVALCARSPEACAAASRKLALRGEVFAYPCDLTQPDQIPPLLRAIADHWAPVDVLINNAGIMLVGPAEQMNEADFRAALDIHFWAPLRLIQAVIPHMRAQRAGRIVNISSIDGLKSMNGLLSYSASKFAVRGMTKTAAIELGQYRIRVNSIHPGGVNTPMGNPTGDDDAVAAAFARLPIARIGRPDEIANMALFLASDEASYCTGAEFVVDGGWSCGDVEPGLPGSAFSGGYGYTA